MVLVIKVSIEILNQGNAIPTSIKDNNYNTGNQGINGHSKIKVMQSLPVLRIIIIILVIKVSMVIVKSR